MKTSLGSGARTIFAVHRRVPQKAHGELEGPNHAVQLERASTSEVTTDDCREWELIGKVTLRQLAAPFMPMPPPPSVSEGGMDTKDEAELSPNVAIQTVMLGYMFLPKFWGQGYATESCKALLSHYRSSASKVDGPKLIYVEARVDSGNAGSLRVLEKLQFQKIGFKEMEGPKLFLAGAWRENGLLVYGRYLHHSDQERSFILG